MRTALLLLIGLLCTAATAGTAADPPRVLRVVSWNLQWFPGGRQGATKDEQDRSIAQVRAALRAIAPDILLLQEVGSRAAVEETLKPLGGDWKVAVVSNFKQGGFLSGQQLVIAARLPAEAAWAEPWEKGWAEVPRGYAYAAFAVGGKRLAVYCLHLKSNLGNPADNTSKREDAIEQLLAHMKAGEGRVAKADAVVIGGDFNTDDPDSPAAPSPGERSFGLLRKAGFRWGFEGIAHADRITCPAKGRYSPVCFDHFFTLGLGMPLARVVQAEGSDHLPVVMDVVL